MAARQTKWQVKREASRTALVESAMHAFDARGYAATRVEDIVEGTGYTKGAFYFHFQNKLHCFREVNAHREALRGDWVTELVARLPPELTLAEVLTRTFGHFRASGQGVGGWILVMVDCFQQHRGEPEVEAAFAEAYAVWHDNLTRFVAELQARELVSKTLDPALLAAEAFAYVEGLRAHTSLYALPAERVQEAVLDGLVALLGR